MGPAYIPPNPPTRLPTHPPTHPPTRAALVPSMAHEHFMGAAGGGEGGSPYSWMLYGDDDTIWYMDRVVDIISK
jgi:hypothetical protein